MRRKGVELAAALLCAAALAYSVGTLSRMQEESADFKRSISRAAEECRIGNKSSVFFLLTRARSVAHFRDDEDYVNELQRRFRLGECDVIQVTPEPGSSELALP
jgi:hypothetical protein